MAANEDIGQDILRTLRRLVVATVILYMALAALFAVGYLNAQNQREALASNVITINEALCTFVDDLDRRVKLSQEFLADNPDGIPGISADVLRQSITNQLATIASLSELRCSAG